MSRWCTLTSLLLATLSFPLGSFAQSAGYADPGVVPAGHSAPGYGYAGRQKYYDNAVGPIPRGPRPTIYEELPDDQGWLYEDTPLERILKDSFRHAYFRMEYLNWSITDPGNNVIGAGTNMINSSQLLVTDPTDGQILVPSTSTNPSYIARNLPLPYVDPLTPFVISDPINNTVGDVVVQPSLGGVHINNNNGIRGTFGLPIFNAGTFEASIFKLENSNSPVPRERNTAFELENGIVNIDAVAIPMTIDGVVPTPDYALDNFGNVITVNGVPVLQTPRPPFTDPIGRGDNYFIIFDGNVSGDANNNGVIDPGETITANYQASLKTSVWGTEGNFITKPFDQGSPLSIQMMYGFRYLYFAEDFRQAGSYSSIDPRTGVAFVNATTGNTLYFNRKIDSTTINNMYGPQLGMRAELNSRWLTLGVQPKVMMGLNSYKANLQTNDVLRPGEDALLAANAISGSQSPAQAAADLDAFRLVYSEDTDQYLAQTQSTFGVVGDLEAYTKLNLTQNFAIVARYNFLWAGMLTRPYDNIVYNAHANTADPQTSADLNSDFKLDVKYSGSIIQGVTVGGELSY